MLDGGSGSHASHHLRYPSYPYRNQQGGEMPRRGEGRGVHGAMTPAEPGSGTGDKSRAIR